MNSWNVVFYIISCPRTCGRAYATPTAEVAGDHVKGPEEINQKEAGEMRPRRGGERPGGAGVECVTG